MVPPLPVQLRVYVPDADNGPTDWEPPTALLPDQLPLAVQLVALLADQLRTLEPFGATVVGLAEREMVGPLVTTCTVALLLPEPPLPLQLSVYVAVSGPFWSIVLVVFGITCGSLYVARPWAADVRDEEKKATSPALAASPVLAPAKKLEVKTGDSALIVSGHIINRERIEVSPRTLNSVRWIGVKKGRR